MKYLLKTIPLAFGLIASNSHAATKTWNAGTNTNWDTSTANWSGSTFNTGDDAVFSAAAANGALTLGTSLAAGNIFSNDANTPATTTITGAAGLTLTLGNGVAGTGNIAGTAGVGSYAQSLTYNLTGAGSAFALAVGSGTSGTPTSWNIAATKTVTVAANTNGQIADLNGNTVNLTGTGTVSFNNGVTLQSTGGVGTINVNSGSLTFAGGSSRNTTIANSVTVNVGAAGILNVAANSGGSSAFNQVTNLNGGTMNFNGGTTNNVATVNLGTSTTSIINNASTSGGPPAHTIASLGGSGNANFTRTGSIGTFNLTGLNTTYTGNTTLTSGVLNLADNAGLTFVIGANGINNGITGAGSINLNGDFTFNLAAAGVNLGDSWNIVSNGTLTETYGSTFTVAGFTDNLDNTWSFNNSGTIYTFNEGSGVLSVTSVPEPTVALLGGLSLLGLLRRRRH